MLKLIQYCRQLNFDHLKMLIFFFVGICPTCKKYVNLLKGSKDIPNAVKTRWQSSQLSRCVSTRNCETCTVCSIARSRFPHMKKNKEISKFE